MSATKQNNLFIVANAGRSGSTFLWHLMKANNVSATVLHEDIPVQVTQPRRYNRAYAKEDHARILQDPELKTHLCRWERLLQEGDVIETGWTVYHLLPVLHAQFPSRLRVIVLHREPWSVALSRANMGNYHPRTWYDDKHEVSPYDPRSIAMDYADIWASMNHAEKCLYWWYIVYREVDEFLSQHPSVPRVEVGAHSLFAGSGKKVISEMTGLSLQQAPHLERNPVHKFMLETFPVSDEHRAFERHVKINGYAKSRFGYEFNRERVARAAEKYSLPNALMPRVRHAIDFWSRKRRAGRQIRSLLSRVSA